MINGGNRAARDPQSAPRLPISGLVAPIAVGIGLILHDFSLVGAPVFMAGRPLTVVTLLAIVAYALALAVTRRQAAASLLGVSAVLVAWGYADAPVIGGALLALTAGVLGLGYFKGSWTGLRLAFVVTSLYGVVSLATGSVSLAMNGGFDHLWSSTTRNPDGPRPMAVLMLDGYPGEETLRKWGFDNAPFITALESRGFDVVSRSSSNYLNTQHSLASMLHMRHLHEMDSLAKAPDDARARVRLLARVIADAGPLVSLLTDYGYQVATVPSGVSDVTLWGVHVVRMPAISDYELHLLTTTLVGRFLYPPLEPWIEQAYRETTLSAFETVANETKRGRFLFAHVMSPHRPYVFRADGSPRELPECLPACPFWAEPSEGARDAQLDQIAYINTLVVSTVDRLPTDAVVVVMSDHGTGLGGIADGFRNLIAIRAPGHDNLLPDAATAVGVLPRLLNAYLGSELEIPSDDRFSSPPGTRLELTPWP